MRTERGQQQHEREANGRKRVTYARFHTLLLVQSLCLTIDYCSLTGDLWRAKKFGLIRSISNRNGWDDSPYNFTNSTFHFFVNDGYSCM